MPGKTAKDSLLSREQIIDAAKTLLRSRGSDQLSLRNLGAELGVTAPALYAHVNGKADLLSSLADHGFDTLHTAMVAATVDDPITTLRHQNRAYVQFAQDEPDLFKIMFLPPSTKPTDPLPTTPVPTTNTAIDLTLTHVVSAKKHGHIHATWDPHHCATSMWTAAHGAAVSFSTRTLVDKTTQWHILDTLIDSLLVRFKAPSPTPVPSR